MSFDRQEKTRLVGYASDELGLDGYVLPRGRQQENLYADIRRSAIAYFDEHGVQWWTSPREARPKGGPALPTGHLNSSQVACVNHLEPARVDAMVAQIVLRNLVPEVGAQSLDDGYVEYEWIGRESYLGEGGGRTRGANVTSLDAVMCMQGPSARTIVAIEWKYLESYGTESKAVSKRGTDRVATYRPLLQRSDSPIVVDDIEWLFYEPYYQLMRQTLLAWQMAEHREFGASDWIHINVVPMANTALRETKAAPEIPGQNLEQKWKSVLKQPDRFRLMTPTAIVANTGSVEEWRPWRQWLGDRYLT